MNVEEDSRLYKSRNKHLVGSVSTDYRSLLSGYGLRWESRPRPFKNHCQAQDTTQIPI